MTALYHPAQQRRALLWLRDITGGLLFVAFTIGAFWTLGQVAAAMQEAGWLDG